MNQKKLGMLIFVLSLAACSTAQVRIMPGEGGMNRVVSTDYESDGAEKAARSGGFALDIMDGRGDKNIQQFNIDTALVRGAEGLILVTQDQKLGPVVAAQRKGASFPHLNITDLQGLS